VRGGGRLELGRGQNQVPSEGGGGGCTERVIAWGVVEAVAHIRVNPTRCDGPLTACVLVEGSLHRRPVKCDSLHRR
jgi:hypothetical protein